MTIRGVKGEGKGKEVRRLEERVGEGGRGVDRDKRGSGMWWR